ncbi:MAG: DUF1569 domain-containing protein [Acidobacteriota bacterium]
MLKFTAALIAAPLLFAVAAHATATDSNRSQPATASLALLDRMEARFQDRQCLAPEVSKVDVAWHLAHSIKVIEEIHKELDASDPKAYRANLNPLRALAFARGKLPRGKAKSPSVVLPPDVNTLEDLERQAATARTALLAWTQLPERSFFVHPVFGRLKRDHAERFIEIHTEHHLAIIADIVAVCPSSPDSERRDAEGLSPLD